MTFRPYFVTPSTIVEAYYDIEHDEHVFIKADGSHETAPHNPEADQVALAYIEWHARANGRSGRYLSAYLDAVDRFEARAAR